MPLNSDSIQSHEILNPAIKDHLERIRFLKRQDDVSCFDFYDDQIAELRKVLAYRTDIDLLIKGNLVDSTSGETYVFYPWRKCLVRILDEERFVLLRTARNIYKITPEEQAELRSKVVGVIGLSVGSSLALSLAMERICGTIKIADFDTLETSNLNRIQASICDIGLSKTTIAYRQIVELDPYIKVLIEPRGIREANVEGFILDNPKLDIVAEECDDLEVKVIVRKACKEFGVPVVMETSDRGMIDIERFDLDSSYPILHGFIDMKALETIETPDSRRAFILRSIIDMNKISERARYSISEIGKSITSWPQLATDVRSGSAIAAAAIKQILLSTHKLSGRWYHDHSSTLQNESTFDEPN